MSVNSAFEITPDSEVVYAIPPEYVRKKRKADPLPAAHSLPPELLEIIVGFAVMEETMGTPPSAGLASALALVNRTLCRWVYRRRYGDLKLMRHILHSKERQGHRSFARLAGLLNSSARFAKRGMGILAHVQHFVFEEQDILFPDERSACFVEDPHFVEIVRALNHPLCRLHMVSMTFPYQTTWSRFSDVWRKAVFELFTSPWLRALDLKNLDNLPTQVLLSSRLRTVSLSNVTLSVPRRAVEYQEGQRSTLRQLALHITSHAPRSPFAYFFQRSPSIYNPILAPILANLTNVTLTFLGGHNAEDASYMLETCAKTLVGVKIGVHYTVGDVPRLVLPLRKMDKLRHFTFVDDHHPTEPQALRTMFGDVWHPHTAVPVEGCEGSEEGARLSHVQLFLTIQSANYPLSWLETPRELTSFPESGEWEALDFLLARHPAFREVEKVEIFLRCELTYLCSSDKEDFDREEFNRRVDEFIPEAFYHMRKELLGRLVVSRQVVD